MSYNFLPYNQDQQFLLTPDLQDWVEEDSLERFVSDVVDHLDAEGRLEPSYEGYREAGLAELERVALDGRRIGGDASLDRNRTREKIREEVEEILEEAEQVDAEEDEEYGEDARGDELPENLRTKRGRRIYKERSTSVEPVFGQMVNRGLSWLESGAGFSRERPSQATAR